MPLLVLREPTGEDCPYNKGIRTCNDQDCEDVTPQQTAEEHQEDEEALDKDFDLQKDEVVRQSFPLARFTCYCISGRRCSEGGR